MKPQSKKTKPFKKMTLDKVCSLERRHSPMVGHGEQGRPAHGRSEHKDKREPIMTIPQWLLKMTFAIQYNPNCFSPFLVRLINPTKGMLDLKPFISVGQQATDRCNSQLTNDCLGFGQTVAEAAKAALEVRKGLKP